VNKIIGMLTLIASILVALSAAYSQEPSSRWRYYSTDGAYNDHYYDTKSIVHTSNGIAKVWEKKVATEKSDEIMRTMKDLSELKELNCHTREYRTFVRYYDTTSQPLKSHIEPTQWESIEPESWMEALFDITCKTKIKK
jgi:hypothetical protein